MASALVKDLIDRVQRLVDRVDPSFRGRALSALDEAVQWYASRAPWDSLQREEDIYTNGTQFLVLPDRVQRPVWIADVTNSRHIQPGGQWHSRVPGPFLQKTVGSAREWRPYGTVPVIKQPEGETLTFSTTVSDGIDITVRGLVQDTTASGTALEFYEAQETLTMAGVSQATSNTYQEILAIQKDKNSTADVTATLTTSGDQVVRIPSWASRPLYQQIQLLFKPSAGTQLRMGYFRRPDRLVAEGDGVDPAINEEAVMWRAAGNLHWIDNEGQAAQLAWQRAEEIVTNLKNVEETFGEKDHGVDMWETYLGLEDLGLDYD